MKWLADHLQEEACHTLTLPPTLFHTPHPGISGMLGQPQLFALFSSHVSDQGPFHSHPLWTSLFFTHTFRPINAPVVHTFRQTVWLDMLD